MTKEPTCFSLAYVRIFNALSDEQYQYFVNLLWNPISDFTKSVWEQTCGRTRPQATTTKTKKREEGSSPHNVERKGGFHLRPCVSKEAVLYKMALLLLLLPLIFVVCHPVLVALSIIVSSFRLRQGDYGNGAWNLRPAMVIFYSVALAQGVLYLFWLGLTTIGEHVMVKFVSKECNFDSSWSHSYVRRYLTETRSKCLKDLSATRGRNLITHASDLMDSDHKEDYISGARMLVAFIENNNLLAKALIRSSRNRIQKLILILAWTDKDDVEIRLLAAKVVEHIAGDISLAQFPGTLDCLSSLLSVSEEHPIFKPPAASQGTDDMCQLIIQGLLILEKLCGDEHNRIQICDARLLVRHILAWVFSRPFINPEEKGSDWVTILTLSFNVLVLLASVRGQSADKVHDEIVHELYPSCLYGYASHTKVQSKAIKTFSYAYSREIFSKAGIMKRNGLVTTLLRLFSIQEIKQGESAESTKTSMEAGKALSRLSVHKGNCVAIIKFKNKIFKRDIFSELSEIINSSEITVHYKAVAADILMRLISHCEVKQMSTFIHLLQA